MVAEASSVVGFETGWGMIKSAGFDRALDRLSVSPERPNLSRCGVLDREELASLYALVYRMCTQATPHNWSGKLYYAVLDEMQDICQHIVNPRVSHSVDVLESIIEEWEKHRKLINCCRGILGYLDRFYVQRLALLPLDGVGIRAFHEFVFEPNKDRILEAVLGLVSKDRAGKASRESRQKLRQVTEIYLEVGGTGCMEVYEKDLLVHLLEQSAKEMCVLAERWLLEDGVQGSTYLSRVQAQLAAENERVDTYLHPDSRDPLLRCCEKQLIGAHIERIVENARRLLAEERTDKLELMFVLLRRVPNGLSPMATAFRLFLQEKGADLLARPDYDKQRENSLEECMVHRLAQMHQRYRSMLKESFSEHNTFHRALKEAFEYFINLPLPPDSSPHRLRHPEISISELLSDFLDRTLRKPAKKMMTASSDDDPSAALLSARSESDLDRRVAVVAELFGFVQEKDAFAQFYRKHLAKRLILNRSQSISAEHIVLNKFRMICGNPYVSKFFGMMNDLQLSRDVQRGFGTYLQNAATTLPHLVEANIKVLTSGFWPSYKEERISKLPQELVQVVEVFQSYYGQRTQHRMLTWVHSLGSVEIGMRLSGKVVDVWMSTHQACIMLLFNGKEPGRWLTKADVAQGLGVSESSLERHVRSLVQGKYKLLLTDAAGRLSVNEAFTSTCRKIRVPMMPQERMQETDEDRENSLMKISEERRYAVEATIMRIMKQSKQMRYSELSNKVVEQLGKLFIPQGQTIRKRVDDLIQRDYLKVDAADDTFLAYVA